MEARLLPDPSSAWPGEHCNTPAPIDIAAAAAAAAADAALTVARAKLSWRYCVSLS